MTLGVPFAEVTMPHTSTPGRGLECVEMQGGLREAIRLQLGCSSTGRPTLALTSSTIMVTAHQNYQPHFWLFFSRQRQLDEGPRGPIVAQDPGQNPGASEVELAVRPEEWTQWITQPGCVPQGKSE
jgi:hypothetical protein